MYQLCGRDQLRNVRRGQLKQSFHGTQMHNAERLLAADDIAHGPKAKRLVMGIHHRNEEHTMKPLRASFGNKAQAFIDRDCMQGGVDGERGVA